jgi:tRNA(Ile)-lysidine synthase
MLVEAVRRFFEIYRLEPCGIVAAVSGGVDSTALLLALTSFRDEGFRIAGAHVNHHIRGVDADNDEAYVRTLCARLEIPFSASDGTLNTEAVRRHGIEAAARLAREDCLQAIRRSVGARFIATGHQKNDQAETVVMRLFTGSGIAGLRGIHPVRDDGFIRPLLDVSRAEIESFLSERGVEPRIDRMNADPRFLRVRVRQTLREYDPSVVDSLASVAAQAREQWPLFERAIDAADRDCTEANADATRFLRWPDDAWLRQALLHRHIRRLDAQSRDVSSADLRRIASELDSLKRMHVTKRLELVREKGTVVLRPILPSETAEEYELAVRSGAEVFIPPIGSVMRIERSESATVDDGDRSRQLIQLPPGSDPSFIVRNRRPGDRFRPLGFPAAKKIKDFFIDRKVPAAKRDVIPLVIWNDEIAWVAGVEVSDCFKVDGGGDVYELALCSQHR